MDLRYSESDQEFRFALREWLVAAVQEYGPPPDRAQDWSARREYDTGWQRRLQKAGYAGINWPKEYGGRGAPLSEQLIYYEETALAKAPYVGVNFVGLLHGGPTVMVEGTPEQKNRHIASILRGDEVWCQGFSEPNAGSDLASLRTRAVRDGDHYVVDGHKIWTSFAQVADYCELLVRTDPDASKHGGISWLILDMKTPGIEIRPLKTIAGTGEFSEVFLDGVRIPVSDRVGEENDGWRVANVTLRFERGTSFASEMVKLNHFVAQLIGVAREVTTFEGRAWEDRALRRELGHIQAELDALGAMLKLSVSQAHDGGVPGVGASALKLVYTELYQRISELAVRVLGRAGLSLDDLDGFPSGDMTGSYLQSLSLTIAAGSSQIQRNIIGERILGLPKDR
ncbi:MAG: acyl-CoA dehydrogenase family protein [Myxococcota bacterium]|nr:acyl-CoA dehydrogenase family protein [Myxococcota bacterium]